MKRSWILKLCGVINNFLISINIFKILQWDANNSYITVLILCRCWAIKPAFSVCLITFFLLFGPILMLPWKCHDDVRKLSAPIMRQFRHRDGFGERQRLIKRGAVVLWCGNVAYPRSLQSQSQSVTFLNKTMQQRVCCNNVIFSCCFIHVTFQKKKKYFKLIVDQIF